MGSTERLEQAYAVDHGASDPSQDLFGLGVRVRLPVGGTVVLVAELISPTVLT